MSAASHSDRELLAQPPALRFDDRVVWITGAGRGLGRTLAFALAGAGARVVLSARSEQELSAAAAEIEAGGGAALALPCAVDDPEAVAATVAEIERAHGRLDVLVNNAGISPHFKRAEEIEPAQLAAVLETNLVGAFSCARAALGLLEAGDGGAVVNVSSVHGSRALERLLAYSVSKGGLELLTRTLALEWASRGIRVNSLAPGYIETEMTAGLLAHPRWGEELRGRTPLGRFATTAEIAACAMFLASPISSYVTGATLAADGGWSAR